MNYATYGLASDRLEIELKTERPQKWNLEEVSLVVMAYKGTELMCEDTIHRWKFSQND